MTFSSAGTAAIFAWFVILVPCHPAARRNSGHIVNLEQPEEFNRIVLDFLAHLPKR
jgi:pimeloyl-ACP methyl ester carboxylesterase